MKTYTEFSEGIFSRKSPEEKKLEQMRDDLSKLAQKSAGRGGWSKKEQDRYNDLWMKMHKKGKTPTLQPPSVYGDDSWGTKTKVLQKKLKLTQRDHKGVL